MKTFLIFVHLSLLTSVSLAKSAGSAYIELYKNKAIHMMYESGVPASIILGVAIHESASGTSKIAKLLNNHFGVKGKNNHKLIHSSYKAYQNVEASYRDFIKLLQRISKFKSLFKQCSNIDYRTWVKGMQRGGYAHSQKWGKQVLAIIKKYHLYQYDTSADQKEQENLVSKPNANEYLISADSDGVDNAGRHMAER